MGLLGLLRFWSWPAGCRDRPPPGHGGHPIFAQASHALVAALFGLTGTSRQCALDLGFAHPSGGFSGADFFAHPLQYTGRTLLPHPVTPEE